MGMGGSRGGSSGGKQGNTLIDQIKGPPAQGQPATLAALREVMAARPGAGITPDPTGANFYSMPQPNGAYAGSFEELLSSMLARGPQGSAAAPAAATPGAGTPAGGGIGSAANGMWQTGIDSNRYRGQGMSNMLWQRSVEQARADAERNGATPEELAAWDTAQAGQRPPRAPNYISPRGGR